MDISWLYDHAEAAQSCKVILDTVESASPDGLPENFESDCKLLETLTKAVELLPELWKLAHVPQEAILSYRRALLYRWHLDLETRTKLEKDFATFLLYSGIEAAPPNLRSQTEDSFIPRNNIEEAILLLLVLLRKFTLKRIIWDPSILDHLCFALSLSGEFIAFARQIEELPPGIIEGKGKYTTLALCYYSDGDYTVALNLLRNVLNNRENKNYIFELLLASKICGNNRTYLEEGIGYARKVLSKYDGECEQMVSVANLLLGISLSSQSQKVASDSQRISAHSEALKALESAQRTTSDTNPTVLFYLSLENAEQRKLDVALYYAKLLLKTEAGSGVRGWILLARILSAQKRYADAENVIDAALDETGKWNQAELLRTKAKLQIAQGNLSNAIETYTHVLAVLQVQRKSFGINKKLLRVNSRFCDSQSRSNNNKSLEMEIWHDLANLYTSLSQWRDADICLSKSEGINPHSASRLHSKGMSLPFCLWQFS